jgi:hypothetical protein
MLVKPTPARISSIFQMARDETLARKRRGPFSVDAQSTKLTSHLGTGMIVFKASRENLLGGSGAANCRDRRGLGQGVQRRVLSAQQIGLGRLGRVHGRASLDNRPFREIGRRPMA